jgi:hypothetical protein
MIHRFALSLTLALLSVPASGFATTSSSGAHPAHSSPKPRVTESAARAIAMARVPGAQVKSHELEREHGKLVYSYDLAVPGKSGIEEVQVDARTGKIVAVEHETPKAEQREKAQEQKAPRKGTGTSH